MHAFTRIQYRVDAYQISSRHIESIEPSQIQIQPSGSFPGPRHAQALS